MYPTVVIVIVETQRSMTDLCEVRSSRQGRATSTRLSFAVDTRQTITVDKESRYERSCTFQVEDGQQHDREKVIGTSEKSRQSERTRRSVGIESDSV